MASDGVGDGLDKGRGVVSTVMVNDEDYKKTEEELQK